MALENGAILDDWKTVVLISLLKAEKYPIMVSSYRLISLTPCVGKLMELLVNNRLTWRLEKYGLLNHRQFGFRPGALWMHCYIIKVERKITVAAIIDFEATLDKIPHCSVLLNCLKFNIRENMLIFIYKLLTVVNDQGEERLCCIRWENGLTKRSVFSI